MTNIKELWDQALVEIELSTSRANFNTWFKNTSVYKEDAGVIYLSVPNTFVRDWLLAKYHKQIIRALRNNSELVRNVEYVISKNTQNEKQIESIKKENLISQAQIELTDLQIIGNDGLNPRYTFETFIVGPFNELAHAATQSIVKNPGINYNPLFIYGGTGLGKTHLIQSVGNYIKKINPDKKVLYTTSERFTSECVDAIRNNKMFAFKERYQKYDVLIMDDIQFFSGKEKTQEELFHLFNNLYEKNKQIIFSSDKAPKHIINLEERLRSRFEGGMIVDVSKPDFESRVAILKSKSVIGGYTPTDEVIEYIASVIQDNIRELEGVLNSIICQSQLKKKTLTVPDVKQLIKNNIQPQKNISIKDVIQTVSDFYNIDEKTLCEKTRRKEVVKPRQITMYILREYLNTSYPYIGSKLGGKDHTTVIHACEKIKRDIQLDTVLLGEIDQIKQLLYSS